MPKKTGRGDPLGFFNIHSVEKKIWQCRKNERGDPLVSPGMVCYAEKQEKPFWFSSLGQIVQFGAIIFCRTLKNYFGQWIEKKRVTIIVAFHFMKRRLKIINANLCSESCVCLFQKLKHSVFCAVNSIKYGIRLSIFC